MEKHQILSERPGASLPWKSNKLTLIKTRKKRDVQFDNDYKKINIRKI
jgi:hypothetical protein